MLIFSNDMHVEAEPWRDEAALNVIKSLSCISPQLPARTDN